MSLRSAIPATDHPGVRRVGYVFGLPLVDGVFVTLVLAGVLESVTGVLLVGAVVFCGSGTLAIVLAELADEPRDHLPGLLAIGLVIVALATVEAALAPLFASALDVAMLTWVGAGVLLLLGARVGSRWLATRLPEPRLLVLVGLILSLRPMELVVPGSLDLWLGLAGGGAALAGLAVASVVLVLGCRIRRVLDGERFRFGGGVALCVLGASLLTSIPAYGSLLVLAIAVALSVEESTVDELRFEAPTSGEEPAVKSEYP